MASDGVGYAYVELRHWFESQYRQGDHTAMAVDWDMWSAVCGVSPSAVREALALLESEGHVVVEHVGPYAVCHWTGA